MTLLAIKKFFKKSWAWCVDYWRWISLGFVLLLAYIAGRRKGSVESQTEKLKTERYKKEAEAIEKSRKAEVEAIKNAKANLEDATLKAEDDYDKAMAELQAERKEKIKNLADQDAIDSSAIDAELEKAGIRKAINDLDTSGMSRQEKLSARKKVARSVRKSIRADKEKK